MKFTLDNKIDIIKLFMINLILILTIIIPGYLTGQTIKFKDVTVEKAARGNVVNGVSCYAHGVAFADISGDSLVDIYISNAVRDANKLPEVLYISAAGKPYIENDYARGVDDPYGITGSHGIIFLDYDNDGDLDIFNATTDDRNRLYQNNGNGFYVDATNAARIPALGLGTRGVVAFDANNDGYLDLYGVNWGPVEDQNWVPQPTPPQPNEFHLNNGNGTFIKDDSRGLSIMNPANVGAQGVTAADLDNDGDMDVYVSYRNYSYLGKDENGVDVFGPNWQLPALNAFFVNDGTGRFTNQAKSRGFDNPYNDCNGTTFADYDNDGDLDGFVVNKQVYGILRIYRNDGNGNFLDISFSQKIYAWGFSCLLFDVDNDGDLDLYTMNPYGENVLYKNDGRGNFTQLSNTGLEKRCDDVRAGAVGDIDNDGDLDLYIVDANKKRDSDYSNYLFRNDTQTTHRWLKVTGRGPRGDLGGFGTKIWLFDRGHMNEMAHLVGYKQVMNAYGYLCQDDPVQHFGLGQRDTVDVKIQLLDGTTLTAFNVGARKKLMFSKPTSITILDGDGQYGRAGQELANPLRALVKDNYGNPVIGVPVQFVVLDNAGQLVESQPVYTNSSGIATSRYIPGNSQYEQHIQASSSLIAGQTIQFTIYGELSKPTSIELVSASELTGTVATVLSDSIKVFVKNNYNQPQPAHPVRFELTAGNGRLLPGNNVIVEQTTNSSGYAAVAWQLGTSSAAPQELRITSEYQGSPLTGAPVFVTATALPGPPALILKITGDGQTGPVAETLVTPVTVTVQDQYQNPLPFINLRFQVIDGAGKVNETDAISILSDNTGSATVSWKLGQVAGARQHVRVFVVNNSNIFTEFTAHAIAGPAAELKWSGLYEYTGLVGSTLADPLIARVVDSYNNNITSFPVDFQVQQGGGLVNGQANVRIMTDSDGLARCTWTLGPTAGTNNNILKVEAANLMGSPITIYASARTGSASQLLWLGTFEYLGVVGKPLPETLTAKVLDALGNSINSYAVNFQIQEGAGLVNGQTNAQILTNADGMASCTWTLGPTAGTNNNILKVEAVNLAGSPFTIYATATPDRAFTLAKVSGDLQSGLPQTNLAQPLVVKVTDTFGNPINGHEVVYSIVSGAASFNYQTSKTVLTNENGLASALVNLGQQAGSVVITATGACDGTALMGSPVYFSATILTGSFDRYNSTISVTSPVIANGKDPAVIQFCARDAYHNPLAGLGAVINASGMANSLQQANYLTDSTGQVSAYLTSTKAETKKVWVMINGVQALNDSATTRFIAGPAAQIIKTSGDNQAGGHGAVLPDSLKIKVVDQFANPVPDIVVTFKVTSGGGLIKPEGTIRTNSLGAAACQWTLGQNGDQRIEVRIGGNETLAATFAAVFNENRPPRIISYQPTESLLYLYYGDKVHFQVEAIDDDGDALQYNWYLNDTPIAMGFSLDFTALESFAGTLIIKVKISDTNKTVENIWCLILMHTSVTAEPALPKTFALKQNYPNPFNPTTTIEFDVPQLSWVTIEIFNTSGQVIRQLTRQYYSPGIYPLTWDGKDQSGNAVPSGVYYYKMQAGDFCATKKLLMVK